jgi:hypothetical protein
MTPVLPLGLSHLETHMLACIIPPDEDPEGFRDGPQCLSLLTSSII